ncbi:hypothetical protein AB6A40_009323 [Gnathostoma spinigerum]|uniref:Uncharacterized protein n=1 Tax=Gnathostoma spinigerum TaxID=75299 RepID=A0ABD6EWS3_9BILA
MKFFSYFVFSIHVRLSRIPLTRSRATLNVEVKYGGLTVWKETFLENKHIQILQLSSPHPERRSLNKVH